jgi:TonB family protein
VPKGRLLSAALACLVAGHALAQERATDAPPPNAPAPAPGPPNAPGAPPSAFIPPQLVERALAPYPAQALAEKRSGTVVLEFDVDEQGAVSHVAVKTPAGHGFDEAALQAVRRFTWKPARHQGQPVAAHVTYAYRFVYREAPVTRPAPPRSDVVRLRGGLYLRGTRAPVEGHVIVQPKDGAKRGLSELYEADSEPDGHFAVRGLSPGRYHLVITGAKVKRFETDELIGAGEALTVNYFLEPSQYGRYESTVRADINREEIARQTLTTEELVKMPGTAGDALRAVENLPGVARPPFNTGLIIIRGGKPTDSKVHLAGSEVPQLYHFGGFTSIVPSALVDHVDLFAGNFGVRYGRAIAGAIDLDLREPRRDRFHGAIETNIFDTGLLVEGPVGKGGFVLAARRSYIDAILPAVVPKDQLSFTTAPVYYDYQAMLDYPLGGGKFRALISGTDDQLKLAFAQPADADPALGAFGTHIFYHKLQLRWTRTIGKLQIWLSDGISYTGQSGAIGMDLRFDVWSIVDDLRAEARYPLTPRLRLLVGVDALYANVHLSALIPPPPREGQIPSPFSASERVSQNTVLNIGKIGLYAETVWRPRDRVSITPGLRFDYYGSIRQVSFNPRLSARVQVAKYTFLKAGLGLYSQDPQPTDYDAKFGNPNLHPESALHAALTLEQGLLPGLMLEATGFYKYLYDLATASPYFVVRDSKAVAERVSSDGVGRIYGGELFLRQAVSKYFFGILSYTLMRSERRDCAVCAWRLFDFDQTHVLVLAVHGYLPRGFEVGLRFRYISGYPYTPSYGGFYDADTDVYSPAQGQVNTARLDAYHSLDLRVDKTFLFKRWLLKLYLDVSNVYNHANPELNQPSFDYTRSRAITGLPILPAFGVRGEF